MVEISQRLRKLRLDRHMTQAQGARRGGVAATTVSSYETDIRLPSYEVLIRLADLFAVSADYLLGRDKSRCIDITGLTDEEAAVVSGMVNLLKRK